MDDLDRNWILISRSHRWFNSAAVHCPNLVPHSELNWRNGRAKLAAFHEKFSQSARAW